MSTYPDSLADNEEFRATLKDVDDKAVQQLSDATRVVEIEMTINYKARVSWTY